MSEVCGNHEIVLGLHQLIGGQTVLYEPLTLEGRQVGVLAVGWGSRMRRLPDRTATLVSMLAAESAVAIDREHLISRLEHLARRDELTGLVNRRALGEELDGELARARRSGVAPVLEGDESAAQLIGRADRALYVAKATGRNRTSSASLTTRTEVISLGVAPQVTMLPEPEIV